MLVVLNLIQNKKRRWGVQTSELIKLHSILSWKIITSSVINHNQVNFVSIVS